jgi:hypothetical protein
MIAMVAVAATAFSNGHPDRLLVGYSALTNLSIKQVSNHFKI